MTPVRLKPAAPRSQVKHSTTALPQGFSDGKPPYVLAHTLGRTKTLYHLPKLTDTGKHIAV